jgi:hypothetical protein
MEGTENYLQPSESILHLDCGTDHSCQLSAQLSEPLLGQLEIVPQETHLDLALLAREVNNEVAIHVLRRGGQEREGGRERSKD